MNVQLVITLLVILGMVIGFMSGKFKLGHVAMTATTVLCLTGVLTFKEAYAYFSNSNIVMLGAIFILSGALSKTSLLLKIRDWMIRNSHRGQLIIILFMSISAILANVASPLTALSLMIPFMTALGEESSVKPTHLLYPGAVVAHCCQGALPIGTFFLMINALLEGNNVPESQMLTVVDYAKVIFIPGLISVLYMAFIGWRFFPAAGIDTDSLSVKSTEKPQVTAKQEKIIYVLFTLVFIGLLFKGSLPFDMTAFAVFIDLILMYFGILDLNDVKNYINLDALFMLAGVLPLGTAMQNTGAGDLVSNMILSVLGGNPTPFMILVAFYIAAAFLTQFMSNTATANIFATLAIVTALSRGLDPRPFAIAIYAGATAAMLSPTSSPSVAIAFAAGKYKIVDVLKACLPLWVLYGVAVIFMANYCYPL